jgi:pSer/pThr/pTyr-binding forkhead associated (FHA) protein
MVCRHCGHQNESGARFCSSCGQPLAEGDDPTVTLTAIDEADHHRPTDATLAALPAGVGLVVVARGPNAGSTYRLEAEPVAAGRHPDSDIFLDDITVSRRHAVIERSGETFLLRDVGSLNGTYVNRERVEESALHDGDEIQIGRFVLSFHVGGSEG